MKDNNLTIKPKRRFIYGRKTAHNRIITPNLLQRKFDVAQPNTHWVSDITYIRTKSGWLYLAVIIDLYSRAVVGWETSNAINTQLVLQALKSAIIERNPLHGLILHSDRGVQYANFEFHHTLKKHGIISSMSRQGNCWDNAVAESFFKSLKNELKIDKKMESLGKTNQSIQKYIDSFYNTDRLHSSLKYMPPHDFENTLRVLD